MNPPENPPPSASVAAAENPPVVADAAAGENFPLGLAAGLGAALVGAAGWAAFTVATDMKIGWIAVGIGFLVGYAVRTAGKGSSERFAFAGAALALLGCVLGNYFTVIAVVAGQQHLGFFGLLFRITPGVAMNVMTETFQPMDLVFYAIAVYEGFKFGRVKSAG